MRIARRLSILACVGLLTACGGSGGGDGGGDASAPGGRRSFLSIGTAPVVGGFYLVGGALAEVLNENQGPIQWDVTAEATKGSQENIRRLAQGQIELAMSNSAITYHAVRGESGWEQPYDVKVVMTLAPNVAQFISKKGSGIESLSDLAGNRVAVGPAGAGFEQFVGPLLAAHDLTYDDFSPINATQSASVDMLKDGTAVAAFLGGAVPHPAITQASATLDVQFLPYAETAREELTEAYAFFWPVNVPAGTYKSQDADFPGMNVGSMHLITSGDQDEELVYEVTKTIWENRAAVVQRTATGRAINEGNVARNTGTDFHPGAIRFYQEIGVWTE
ncbi:MAG: TAXI family TRAP transporter solute-binding subunit [Acidobacteriota bacterium]|nr:TAXI family TRAP transporter solute-binding subunit [Acidobacteriota bacterium]